MYTEELEGFEEGGKTPRTYVSNMSNFSQQDAEKLARENEKLKKNLEKEKFFNRLLDQELKEVKAEGSSRHPADFRDKPGVSKGAFYTVLIIALGLAGYIGYGFYTNSQASSVENDAKYAPADNNDAAEQTQDFTTNTETAPAVTPPVTDSVPNIIGKNNNGGVAEKKKTEEVKKEPDAAQQKAVVPPVVAPKNTATTKSATAAEDANKQPAIETRQTATKTTPPPVVTQQQPVQQEQQPSRPVIARYKVTSKANFYNGPDENTLRSAFISAGPNKFVDALDDKNGFIYVEYVNDHGMLSKGWLSKTDLTKSEE